MEFTFALRRLRRHWPAAVGTTLLIGVSETLLFLGATLYGAITKPPSHRTDDLTIVRLYRNPGPPPELLSYYDVEQIQTSSIFPTVAVARTVTALVESTTGSRVVLGEAVSDRYFSAVGVTPTIGREFSARSSEREAVISPQLAQSLFGSAEGALGMPITISGRPYAVIGVVPPSFSGIWSPAFNLVHYWVRLNEIKSDWPTGQVPPQFDDPSSGAFVAVAALASASIPQSLQRFNALGKSLEQAFPTALSRRPRNFLFARQDSILLSASADSYVRPVITMNLIVGGALVVVLLVFVSSLSARYAAGVEPQLRIRHLLGAPRFGLWAPLTYFVTVVAVSGTVTAWVASHLLLTRLSANSGNQLTALGSLQIAPVTWWIGICLSTCATVIGTLPVAWRALTPRRQYAHSPTRMSEWRARAVVSGVAVSLALSIAAVAGAVVSQLGRVPSVRRTDLVRQVHIIGLDSTLIPMSRDQRARYGEAALRSVRRNSGVLAAGWIEALGFFAQRYHGSATRHVSVGSSAGFDRTGVVAGVSAGWADATLTALAQGRLFRPEEFEQEAQVALVPESVARVWWPHATAIGQHVLVAPAGDPGEAAHHSHAEFSSYEVVGVIRDWAHNPDLLWVTARPIMVPRRDRFFDQGFLVVRSRLPRAEAASLSRRQIREDLGSAPIRLDSDFQTLVSSEYTTLRLLALALSALAVVALLLAAGGLVILTLDDIVTRQRELGIRAALGATLSHVLSFVMGRYAVVIAVAAVSAVGLILSSIPLLNKFMLAALFGRPALSPQIAYGGWALLAGVVALGGLTAAACAFQLLRLDPARAIRDALELP